MVSSFRGFALSTPHSREAVRNARQLLIEGLSQGLPFGHGWKNTAIEK
jgi:hypothetical protein